MVLKIKNNAESTLKANLASTWVTTITLNDWEWELFPTTWIFRVTVEQFITLSSILYVKKREIIEITWRTWDILTIWTRTVESCVQDETVDPKVLTSVAQEFNWWDKISIYFTAWKSDEQDAELLRLENDKKDISEIDAELLILQWEVDANTALAHSHANKALLDTITAAFTTALKTKLDWIEANANNYSLPIATTFVLWWVKPDGTSILIDWAWNISSVAQGWWETRVIAQRTSNQSADADIIVFNNETLDLAWEYNPATWIFTASETWYYLITANILIPSAYGATYAQNLYIRKNSTNYAWVWEYWKSWYATGLQISAVVSLAINDTIDIYMTSGYASIQIWVLSTLSIAKI